MPSIPEATNNLNKVFFWTLILFGAIISLFQLFFLFVPLLAFLIYNSIVFFAIALHFIIRYNDYFFPASLIILTFVLRTFFPGFLLLGGIQPSSLSLDQAWYSDQIFWQKGIALASTGIYFFLLFFQIPLKRIKIYSKMKIDPKILIRTSFTFFFIGLLIMYLYIQQNFGGLGAFFNTILKGLFRAYESKPGTAKIIYLSNEILNFSVIGFGIFFYHKKKKWFWAILPALIILFMRLPLGGRVNAVQPLLMTLLGIWYLNRKRFHLLINWKKIAAFIFKSSIAVFIALFFANIILQFRSGGLGALTESIAPEAFWEYLKFSVWTELGFISPFAFAIKFGQAAYPLPISRIFFTMYIGYFLGINDYVAPGEFIVTKVNGSGGWGLHTGAINDFYLGFGLYEMLIGMAMLGLVTKFIYVQFKPTSKNNLNLFVYLNLFPVLYWSHFESVLGIANVIESFSIWIIVLFLGITFYAKRK